MMIEKITFITMKGCNDTIYIEKDTPKQENNRTNLSFN